MIFTTELLNGTKRLVAIYSKVRRRKDFSSSLVLIKMYNNIIYIKTNNCIGLTY